MITYGPTDVVPPMNVNLDVILSILSAAAIAASVDGDYVFAAVGTVEVALFVNASRYSVYFKTVVSTRQNHDEAELLRAVNAFNAEREDIRACLVGSGRIRFDSAFSFAGGLIPHGMVHYLRFLATGILEPHPLKAYVDYQSIQAGLIAPKRPGEQDA